MIRLTIPGPPCGKQRARTFYDSRVHRVVSKTPEKTVNYETLVRQIFAAKYPRHTPWAGAIRMGLSIYVMPSKADERLMRKRVGMSPMKKPDIDNVLKICADSLNGLAYADDKQIVSVSAERLFSERPRVEIEVEEIAPHKKRASREANCKSDSSPRGDKNQTGGFS